jgi:glycosyltransferase involved in cell wall biosynthesis
MPKNLLFSIIIPTYNRAAFLTKTIESVLQQTYTNLEIIIVDDGSKDNTEEVVNKINDRRINYYKKQNEERGAARNFGVSKSKGDYINFFDSDDTAYPNHLETAIESIKKHNFPELFHLGYDLKYPDGKIAGKYNSFDGNIVNYAIKTKKVSINSLFVKREIAVTIPFSENRLLSASEDALYLCLLCARYPLYCDNTITTSIIEHTGRSMAIATEKQLLSRRSILINELEKDTIFMNKHGKYIKDIYSESTYLLCLSCLMEKRNSKAIFYFKEYLKNNFFYLFSIRTIVVAKKILLNLFTGKN